MSDPTYVIDEIQERQEWRVAFALSEVLNDNAPLGWSRYIPAARAAISASSATRMEQVVELLEDEPGYELSAGAIAGKLSDSPYASDRFAAALLFFALADVCDERDQRSQRTQHERN